MEDREFFDELYQQWSKTTGSDDSYWMPEAHFDNSGRFNVYSIDKDDKRKLVASGLSDWDADWVTAVHGCFGDLWRRLHSALDESDEADLSRDERECRIYELEVEVDALQKIIADLSDMPPWGQRG